MHMIFGEISELTSAIEEYREAAKELDDCCNAWESGDPCEMAANDPSDQFIKEEDRDRKWEAAVAIARKLAPWVKEFRPLVHDTRGGLISTLSLCLMSHEHVQEELDYLNNVNCDDAETKTKASLRVAQEWTDVVDSIASIAGVEL